MKSVLIAHRDTGFAAALAADLATAGFSTVVCPGPWPPRLRCIRCDVGYCPLSEGADLMVYDPEMMGRDADGTTHNLALESAQAHPDVPMILAVPGGEVSLSVRKILEAAPNVQIASTDRGEIVDAVRSTAFLPSRAAA